MAHFRHFLPVRADKGHFLSGLYALICSSENWRTAEARGPALRGWREVAQVAKVRALTKLSQPVLLLPLFRLTLGRRFFLLMLVPNIGTHFVSGAE